MRPLAENRLKPVVLAHILLACLAGLPALAGEAVRYSAVLSEDDRRITYNSCGEDASGECASHALFCGPDGFNLVLPGTGEEGRDTRSLAQALIMAPWGEARLRFHLAGGSQVEVPIASVQVELNEMNADWDVTLKSYEASQFFEALNRKSVRGAAVEIAGRSLPLAPRAADETKLLAFKKACNA